MAKKYMNKKNKIYLEIFPSFKTLTNITNLEKRFTDGQIIKIEKPKENESEFYVYKNGQIIPLTESTGITIYDVNRQIYAGAPQYDVGQIERAIEDINKYDNEHKASHYMLLGKDINYYTVLINDPNFFNLSSLGSEVIECLENIGQIKEIIKDEFSNSIECWITVSNSNKETIVLYLFPYDEGIVRFGR